MGILALTVPQPQLHHDWPQLDVFRTPLFYIRLQCILTNVVGPMS